MSKKNNRRISECTSQIKTHFDCVICANTFNGHNPAKALPCVHTYCARCLDRMVHRGRIECPECRKIHVVPKGGTSNFNTNYFVMQLIDDIKEFDSSNNSTCDSETTLDLRSKRTAENALCDIAIYSLEKLHNEVRHIRRQIDSQHDNVIDIIKEAEEACKRSVTSTIMSLQKRLQETQQSVHSELEQKTAYELSSIESKRTKQNDVFENIAQFCESKVQSLQVTGSLQGVEWDHLIEEIEGHEKRLTSESNMKQKMLYKIVTMPDMSVTIPNIETLGIVNEKEMETNFVVRRGNEVIAMPSMTRSMSIKKLVRQSRLSSEQTHDRSGKNIKRDRDTDREKVVIKPAFSEDTPSSLPRVFLAPHHESDQSCEISTTNHSSNQGSIGRFAIKCSGASRCPGKKPALPSRKLRTQELKYVNKIREVESDKVLRQESIAKVNIQVVPSGLIEMGDSNTLQPLGLVTIDGAKFAIASGNGFKIIEKTVDKTEDLTPRSCVRTRAPQIFTDVCRLQDGTFLCAVEGTKDILKFNEIGKPSGTMEIIYMGNRLKSVVQPFGIACDKDGTIYISDHGNGCILVCNRNGILRNVIGRKGTLSQQLQHPMYLTLKQTTEALIYVADSAKHQVVVFMSDGTFIRALSATQNNDHSSSATQNNDHSSSVTVVFTSPAGCAQTRDGQIVVSDRKLHKVFVIDPISDTLLKEFGGLGSSRGQFDTPMGVSVIDDNKLAICDCNNFRVQLFDWPL